LRDAAAENGDGSEKQWKQIASLLNKSWVSLQKTVVNAPNYQAESVNEVSGGSPRISVAR
jgi:hypothetical protein